MLEKVDKKAFNQSERNITMTNDLADVLSNKKMPENNFCLMMLVWQLQRQTKICHQHLRQLSSE